jgi:enoyl-CoA hydratase
MAYTQIIYEAGTVARVIMNRPRYLNALSRILLDEIDDALIRAEADGDVKVIVLSGAGKHFSAGHDLGTPEEREDRKNSSWAEDGIGRYMELKRRFVEMGLRWHDLKKPTIAMVQGYCIFGGWMVATAMDIVFAAENALFLPSHFQYFSVPWDIGPRKAKEILFEHRFMTAQEARFHGFVNRVYPDEALEQETIAYARRVAENDPFRIRIAKQSINHMMDAMGYSAEIKGDFQSYFLRQTLSPSRSGGVAGQRDNSQSPGIAQTDVAKRNLALSKTQVRVID